MEVKNCKNCGRLYNYIGGSYRNLCPSCIEQWIREERLSFSDDSPIGIACEVCGATIRTGRYCERCKNDLANRLGGMYGSRSSTVDADKIRERREKARMRFLDK